jgi:hypothetical protein
MKKNSLVNGIKALLTPYQWSKLFDYEQRKLKESNAELNKFKRNLQKGQKVRSKNISRDAKQDKKILLEESKQIKKINPSIKRKALAAQLEIFSKDYKSNGLSKPFSYSHIYKEILK